MTNSIVVTARIGEQRCADLGELQGHRDRRRAWLIERAMAAFANDELELHRSLAAAEAEIERGEFVTKEDLMAGSIAKCGERRQAA